MATEVGAPGLALEHDLWSQGYTWVAGIDEAGRGALAGPVSAGVVVLPNSPEIAQNLSMVRDSKLLNAAERERAAVVIRAQALAWEVGFASAAEIDSMGILPSTRLAVRRAVQGLPFLPQYFLLDYLHWPDLSNPHLFIPRGESHSLSIAAASVLAKTARDALMRGLEEQFPGYAFILHKGYGTSAHAGAIARLGLSAEHRRTFCKAFL